MSISRSETLEFICLLCRRRKLQLTVKKADFWSLFKGLFGAPSSLLGSQLVGSAVGNANYANFDRYKSAAEVIREDLDEDQQRRLADSVRDVVNRVNSEAVVNAEALLRAVTQDDVLEGAVMDAMKTFFNNIDMPLAY